MTDSKAMMAMFDAFDNANQGLAIWDEGDNLIGFNSIYRDIFKNNMLSEPKIGINFGQSYEEASKKPEFQVKQKNMFMWKKNTKKLKPKLKLIEKFTPPKESEKLRSSIKITLVRVREEKFNKADV